ncbi:hypothetical protein [Paenibacillus agri]|uniref:Uncharacterized protein n=1 Tax=Paenibacillus agri TaxID=2744309 RepID=A0A850ERR6_9BACL|nr:hypothetical protein [Paenibacillus agri]NUU62429.1 hypothetical protein [Paenibacillus agri]
MLATLRPSLASEPGLPPTEDRGLGGKADYLATLRPSLASEPRLPPTEDRRLGGKAECLRRFARRWLPSLGLPPAEDRGLGQGLGASAAEAPQANPPGEPKKGRSHAEPNHLSANQPSPVEIYLRVSRGLRPLGSPLERGI